MKLRVSPTFALFAAVLCAAGWATFAFTAIASRDPAVLREWARHRAVVTSPLWLGLAVSSYYVSRQPRLLMRVFGWGGLALAALIFVDMVVVFF